MESETSEFRNRLDGFQKEQLKQGREITCLCVECERLQLENKDLRRRLTQLEERLDRIEDNGRRNNLLFCGLPEDENESVFDCERKALNLIHRVLGVQKEVPIERVYRTGTAITVQFLSRKDRDLVLSSARHLRGSNLSVKEDVSPRVGQKRKGLTLPLSDQQTRNQRKGTSVHHDNLVSGERVFANAMSSKNGVEVGVTEEVLVNAMSNKNGVEVGVTEGVVVNAMSNKNGVEVDVTKEVLANALSSKNGVEVGVTEGVLVSALSSENGVEVGVTEEYSFANALSIEDVKLGVTGAAELAGHCQRAPVPASRGHVARRESPRSDRGRLDPAREERRQVRRGTVHDVEASGPAVTNGSNSTRTCPSECLSCFHHQPGSCNSPDKREKDTFGASLSACSGPPENDTATQNQHDPAEPFTSGDSKSLGDEIDNFYTGAIDREADDDVDAAMVKSPLSTFDGTEMFGEMSMDSGISTMTASMMSSSSGWGLSQSFQTASQSLSQSRGVTQLTSFPSSPVSPGDYVQPDSVKPAAADAGTSTPEGFIDSLLEGEGRCTQSDALGTDCDGHINVKDAQAGRDIVGSSNPREGEGRCIEHSVGKHRERRNQHIPRRGPGVGWFSYLEGDGVHVDKEGLNQLTFELNSTQKRRHTQDWPREERPGGSSYIDFDCPRSGGDVYVSWNSPQLGECKHKDNRGEQPGDRQTWLGECKHKYNRGEQSAVSQAYICAQSEGERVHTSNDSPQIGDWNHNSCNRTEACIDNYVSRDSTGGDTRAFSFTKVDSPTEKGAYREYGEQFRPFENSQPGTLFDDSPEEGSFNDSSYEDIVPDVDGSLGRTLTADSPRGLQRRGGSVERIHDQLQTERIPDSSQGRRTRDKIQAGVVSDGTPAGRVPDRLQGETVVDSEREGRVHGHPQGETVLDSQGVGRDHDRLQGVPDKLQGPRIRDQAQAEKVYDSRREAKDHDQIQGEKVLDSQRGGRVHDQLQREQFCQTGSTKKNKLSQRLSAGEADRDVGWHRSGGQWQYCHKRSMADAGLHPANQGALEGKPENVPPAPAAVSVNGLMSASNGEGDARQQEEQDHISRKLTEMQDSILLPIKEDLSEWITRIIGVEITPDTFIEVLDSGVALCTISKLIEKHAQEYAKEGKLTEPLPEYKLKCNSKAKSGTWFSRDNVTNFLGWCRAYGMTDETMFDSEDLVSHKQEKPVVNCVLELARIGWKYGIEPPNLIRMEREIEKEAKEFEPPPFIPKPVEVVTPKPVEKPVEKKPEKLDLHKEVKRMAFKCKCQEYVNRISEGVYDVFGKRVFIRLLHGKHLMVRVGGGWDTFENYLLHHDPIQVYEFRRPASRDSSRNNFDGYLVIKSKYKSL